ncbi:MAG: ABC transporter permease [Myxococcales bacterium]
MPTSHAERLPVVFGSRAVLPKRRRPAPGSSRASQLAFFVIVIALWQLGASTNVWETYLFPSPWQVAQKLVTGFFGGTYLRGAGLTLMRLAQGYLFSAVVGVVLGALIRQIPLLDRTIGATIVGLQALPSICWLPLALLWFGLSEMAIIFVVIMGALLSITVATEQGIRNVPPIYVRAARTMGARGVTLYARVILPAALPSIITGMKLGWAFAWRSLMAAELLYVSGGLGQLLMMGREFNDIAEVVSVMVLIVFIGLLTDRLVFGKLEAKVRERFGYDRA